MGYCCELSYTWEPDKRERKGRGKDERGEKLIDGLAILLTEGPWENETESLYLRSQLLSPRIDCATPRAFSQGYPGNNHNSLAIVSQIIKFLPRVRSVPEAGVPPRRARRLCQFEEKPFAVLIWIGRNSSCK